MTDDYLNFKNWDIEVSPKMYEILVEIFDALGLNVPSSITFQEMEKVCRQMKTIIRSQPRVIPGTNYQIYDNSKIKPLKMVKEDHALVISTLGVIRFQIKTILKHRKINCDTCETLYTGLAEFVKKLPSVVIIDVTGNIEEAVEVIEEIKRISRNHGLKTRIIVLGAALSGKDSVSFLTLGIEKFIDKQFNWHKELDNALYKQSVMQD